MSKRRILRPSISNLIIPTFAGIVSAAGYGIFELYNQPALDSNTLPTLSSLPEVANEETTAESTAEKSIQVSTIPSNATPIQTAQTSEDQYPVDQTYLSQVSSYSMAAKYKDHLILSPASASIWEKKAKKLIETADKDKSQSVWTHWHGYLDKSQINGAFVHNLCTKAASYSEWGTFFSIIAYKGYFDFLWNTCGREGKEKPSDWWYK